MRCALVNPLPMCVCQNLPIRFMCSFQSMRTKTSASLLGAVVHIYIYHHYIVLSLFIIVIVFIIIMIINYYYQVFPNNYALRDIYIIKQYHVISHHVNTHTHTHTHTHLGTRMHTHLDSGLCVSPSLTQKVEVGLLTCSDCKWLQAIGSSICPDMSSTNTK